MSQAHDREAHVSYVMRRDRSEAPWNWVAPASALSRFCPMTSDGRQPVTSVSVSVSVSVSPSLCLRLSVSLPVPLCPWLRVVTKRLPVTHRRPPAWPGRRIDSKPSAGGSEEAAVSGAQSALSRRFKCFVLAARWTCSVSLTAHVPAQQRGAPSVSPTEQNDAAPPAPGTGGLTLSSPGAPPALMGCRWPQR